VTGPSADPAAGNALAKAAEALVGTRFRLHGRDPASGLDCVGLVAASLTMIGRPARLPNGYQLRARDVSALFEHADHPGAIPATGAVEAGDVALMRIGPCQFHMAVARDGIHFIHAHAGLRRVVIGELPGDWTIIRRWRLIGQFSPSTEF
jgi:hypothetical protein